MTVRGVAIAVGVAWLALVVRLLVMLVQQMRKP